MKNFWNKLVDFFESLERAKAAAHLSRLGLHEQAKALMLAD